MIATFFALVAAASAATLNSDFDGMKRQFEKAHSCAAHEVSAKTIDVNLRSVACFTSVFSEKLSPREQAGLSTWFNALGKVVKVSACDGQAYQIESYHEYTPHFICVEFVDENHEKVTRVIFFEKPRSEFRISSIYKPMTW